ncbi:short-chain dehydrogenase [Gordoniibacillus kamchatkensis]|uniref:Short-chain dehydrogenase n=1 Tax=Gordoniibacillus kamchatkensis TaxID=1590651 RepID=A0ABR5AHG6_9BACL|nr:SDR family oxidoreductase [Paenibacillus sp. VKM B-2647]KIL40500.1 short-chain dehydrogenase [Paenibacillus sp. VKM B-2647]
MRLHDKVVFITDADSPSGKAIIDRLSGEGAHFVLNSVSGGENIRANVERCQSAGSKVFVVNIDLCQSSEVEDMLESAAGQLGTVDILVHNNNVVRPISVETGEEALFLDIMNANAKSAFICTKAVGKQMEAKQSGKVVYVSSIHAEKPTGSSFAYSASKGAVKMLTREASIVLGRHGVNVNAIEFGPVEGDDAAFESDISTLYHSYRYKVPNAVLGSYEDLANLVLFLSADEARYLNGADIRMDGGFLMHYMDFKMKRPGGSV